MRLKTTFLIGGLAMLGTAVQAQTNTSVISQTGNSQSAAATQTGSANESIIRQLTGTSSTPNTGNTAVTTQSGNGRGNGFLGRGIISQSNQATIDQLNGSFYNKGSISQSGGSGNQAGIEQNGNGTFFSGGTEQGNQASISQIGQDNQNVTISQNAGTLGRSQE